MARKSRKSIPETVSSAAVQEEIKRPFRAGLYARISTETEETIERGTIETQVELMKNYVADTEDISVAEVYKDSDYSGTNFDRPGFTQMMEDIKHGKINCVIVKDLSRLGRNYVETSNYIERVFPFFHVRFLAVTDDFDSFREGVDLTVPLKNIINEFYSKDLVAFMLMSLALSALLIAFEHSYNLLKELKLATSNLEQAFDTKPLSYKEEKVKLSHFDITFENVDFSYNQQTDVLHNISFHAPEGSTTALIGPSGSGKSTVANLIARFWDVTKGCVRIGGQDIRELNPDGLLHYISEVFQENTLLSDTIYNNIKAGREDATEQEVIAAAKAAHCHEFIERLPNGYQTHLAEGGNTLSGGEKQRIAIARAILKDAPILLLDESTASLDADNEAKINQALDRLMKGKTVFVIAHRLNTIQNADQIIVLNQGRIEETGTHEELLRKKGHYYEMVQEQQKAREWIVKGA